jgi:hypothetical protein
MSKSQANESTAAPATVQEPSPSTTIQINKRISPKHRPLAKLKVVKKFVSPKYTLPITVAAATLAQQLATLVPSPAAGAAVSVLLLALECVQKVQTNQDACWRLINRSARILLAVNGQMDGRWESAPPLLLKNLEKFKELSVFLHSTYLMISIPISVYIYIYTIGHWLTFMSSCKFKVRDYGSTRRLILLTLWGNIVKSKWSSRLLRASSISDTLTALNARLDDASHSFQVECSSEEPSSDRT